MEALEREGSLLTESIPSPVEEVIVSEEVERLRDGCFLAMAGKLPLNQRAAFSLVDIFGVSIPVTAEILNVTPKAVEGLLYLSIIHICGSVPCISCWNWSGWYPRYRLHYPGCAWRKVPEAEPDLQNGSSECTGRVC